MKTLLRDVMFPAAGAIGLLAMLLAAPAGAQSEPTQTGEPEAVFAAATLPGARSTETARFSSELGRATVSATADRDQAAGAKPRCDRISRIGKVTMTRCD